MGYRGTIGGVRKNIFLEDRIYLRISRAGRSKVDFQREVINNNLRLYYSLQFWTSLALP